MIDYPIPLLGWPLCAYCLTHCGHEAECGAELDEPATTWSIVRDLLRSPAPCVTRFEVNPATLHALRAVARRHDGTDLGWGGVPVFIAEDLPFGAFRATWSDGTVVVKQAGGDAAASA